MTGEPFRVVPLVEIDEVDDGRCPLRPVRHHLGITAFGVNAWTATSAGDRIINEHSEDEEGGEEELYVVLEGHATFTIDGEEVDAPTGALVFVKPGVRRTAFAQEPQTTILAIGAAPGEAYQPSGWELWAPANQYFAAGEYERAIEVVAPVVDANPGYGGLLYNLACAESLAGRRDDAIEHLGRAIAISDRSRSLARTDTDFDPLRADPRFAALLDERDSRRD